MLEVLLAQRHNQTISAGQHSKNQGGCRTSSHFAYQYRLFIKMHVEYVE